MPFADTSKNRNDLGVIKVFTGFISAVIMVFILKVLSNIFIPLLISVLLYFLCTGVVRKLTGYKIPRWLVLLSLIAVVFLLCYILGAMVFSSISTFEAQFPVYSKKVMEMFRSILDQFKIPMSDVNNYIDSLNWNESFEKYSSALTSVVTGTFGSFVAFIGNVLMVLIFLGFMLAGPSSFDERIDKAFTGERAQQLKTIVNGIETQVQHYLVIKTFISLLTGALGALILFAGGIDFAILSGLFIFFLNFIPNFGSIIATVIPVLIGLLQYGISLRVVIITLSLMGMQFFIGNILETKITGNRLNLSPIIILISLIFWGYLWGVVGMILAVPLTSAIKIVFENVPTLRPLAKMICAD